MAFQDVTVRTCKRYCVTVVVGRDPDKAAANKVPLTLNKSGADFVDNDQSGRILEALL